MRFYNFLYVDLILLTRFIFRAFIYFNAFVLPLKHFYFLTVADSFSPFIKGITEFVFVFCHAGWDRK